MVQKCLKQIGQVTSRESGNLVTVCCSNIASGDWLSPTSIFPRVHLKDYMLHGAPVNSVGLATCSKWMKTKLFYALFFAFFGYINASEASPCLLAMGNYKNLLSLEVINIAQNNLVHIITFLPRFMHWFEPLHMAVFGPLKAFHYSACDAWIFSHPGSKYLSMK